MFRVLHCPIRVINRGTGVDETDEVALDESPPPQRKTAVNGKCHCVELAIDEY